MENDLIRRNADISALYDKQIIDLGYCGTELADEVISTIKEAPAVDAVEVVRCRECKHHGNRMTGCAYFVGLITPDDWYCPRGQRGEDGDA